MNAQEKKYVLYGRIYRLKPGADPTKVNEAIESANINNDTTNNSLNTILNDIVESDLSAKKKKKMIFLLKMINLIEKIFLLKILQKLQKFFRRL